MIHYSKVLNGLAAYIDAEIAGKMNGSWKAWVVRSAAALASARAESVYHTVSQHPIALALGIVDGENVNVDAILAQLRIQAQRGTATANLPLIGPVTFGISDVDALERYIKGA